MKRSILQYMKQQHMTEPGDLLVVGFSGGADSTCLLQVLHELEETLQIRLLAVHVHHGIRGGEADRDEAFCRAFCDARNIPYESVYVDAPKHAEESKKTLEEAARDLRYEAFRKIAASHSMGHPAKLVVAHHRDDQAETILFHLCRGTGLKGLCGMHPVQQDIIRPLLQVSKQQILKYCEAKKLSYCTDSSNLETAYTRNAIREKVLPLLTNMVNEQSTEHLAKLGEHVLEAETYLTEQTGIIYARCVQPTVNGLLLNGLENLHPYMAGRVIYEAIASALGHAKDVTMEQVERVKGLLLSEKQVGSVETILEGLFARKESDGIYLFRKELSDEEMPEAPGRLHYEILEPKENFIITNDDYTKFFDYDKLNNDLQLRHRADGDYLVVDAMGHKKSLQRYLIDEKIPNRMRDQIWVLADGSHIVWVIGKRISEAVKVTDQTKKILRVDYRE